jgi:uncharacterized protein (TIGR03663 family)
MSQALRKNRRKAQAAGGAKPAAIKPAAPAGEFRRWYWLSGGILTGAAVLRLFALTLKPLHHDEGVNGQFLTNLFRTGYYHYDPANYHGPSLYYFAWITSTFNSVFYGRDGLSTFAIRVVTVLFGLGVIWLLLCLRRQLGTFGVLAAATLAAVSPGMVFFSRYFIHEILFVFFTLAIVVSVLRYMESRRPRDLLLATASAALLGTTKETWIITVGVWLIAIPCTLLYMHLRRGEELAIAKSPQTAPAVASVPGMSNVSQHPWNKVQLYGTATAIFIAIWISLYSSFFTNFPQGVKDSVRTFGYWFQTSSSAHEYGWTKYLDWLFRSESPIMVLGAVGIAIAFWRARDRLMVFCAFWSLGILAAYSLVHYKTPWCALNIILPFVVMAGYGLGQLYESRRNRIWALLILAVASGTALYQSIILNFFEYDLNTDGQPYVYAHTWRDFLSMVDEIDLIASGRPEGKQIGISIFSPEHWPLPWYLRDYPNAGYWGKIVESNQPILIVHENQVTEVDAAFGKRYRRVRGYDLRPGNRLFLYVRNDIQP